MKPINLGVIGTGWCGGIRATTAASSPLVDELHLCDTNPKVLAEVAARTSPTSTSDVFSSVLENDEIDAVVISTTPETTHYPITKAALEAGKHVLLEKPLALTLDEADTLVDLAEERDLKFAIGYSQRFSPKQALVKRSISDGTIGVPVSGLVSRHITRKLGDKIAGRIRLSPAAMEATHDIDFLLWCMEPARPVRVYAQAVERVMKNTYDVADCMAIVITLDSGVVLSVGAGWVIPPGYPNFSSTWIEIVGSEGALFIDDTHRDIILNTMARGMTLPLSTMPGEVVGHVYAGPMHAETLHFLEAVAFDRPVFVTARQARQTMEVYLAADVAAGINEVVTLPFDHSMHPVA